MSPQYRERVVGMALAALFAGAPILAAEPALAEPVESGAQVVFRGAGVLGLTCAARPDTRSITIPAETSLRVLNRTGHRARLLLDGVTQGEIRDSGSADVLFRRGPVTLALRPNCVLSEESRTVRVDVDRPPTDSAPPPSPAAPEPSGTDPPGGGAAPAGSARGGSPGAVGLPDTGGTQPARTAGAGLPDGVSRPRGSGPVAVTTPPGGPRGAVAVPGMPPGDGAVLVPGMPAVETPPQAGAAAAEPVAALAPITDTGRTGLLAVIAVVCVTGVTAGAIRAIAAQRASRIRIA